MNETTKKESRQMDMLHGKIFKNMLIVALPLAACSIMQQLFNSVGVAVVGRFAGSEALAAVGSNGAVINLLVTLFSGISLGSNVIRRLYRRRQSAKDSKRCTYCRYAGTYKRNTITSAWSDHFTSNLAAHGRTEGCPSSGNRLSADLFSRYAFHDAL